MIFLFLCAEHYHLIWLFGKTAHISAIGNTICIFIRLPCLFKVNFDLTSGCWTTTIALLIFSIKSNICCLSKTHIPQLNCKQKSHWQNVKNNNSCRNIHTSVHWSRSIKVVGHQHWNEKAWMTILGRINVFSTIHITKNDYASHHQ